MLGAALPDGWRLSNDGCGGADGPIAGKSSLDVD
jgi:hypothetical protein